MTNNRPSNRRLLLPYALPYFAYVGIATLSSGRLSAEWSYVLRLALVPLLLAWAWRWFVDFTGPKKALGSVAMGLGVGVVGAALWILLLRPFAGENGPAWSDVGFALRLVAAGTLVPIFEELLMRGYVFRAALQWDAARKVREGDPLGRTLDESSIFDVEPGAWSWWAVAISTVAFAAGHQVPEWPAAVAFSLLMSLLWIVRKDLLSCIVAHGTANVVLAIFVRQTGSWGLW